MVDPIPNQAWSYWSQGFDKVDPILRLGFDSWRKNGAFQGVTVLDSKTVFDFVPPRELPTAFSTLPPQLQSDFVRLALLARFGGIWMDMSTLVTAPVAPWLSSLQLRSNAFFFRNPGRGVGGRLFETGFMAASPGLDFFFEWSELLVRLFSRHRLHQAHSQFSNAPTLAKKAFGFLNKRLRKSAKLSSLWAVPPLSWLSIYPFFIAHYAGNFLLLKELHSGFLEDMEFVPASDYLATRSTSNHFGWEVAIEKLAESTVPVHDFEFRKSVTGDEIEALRRFIGGQ